GTGDQRRKAERLVQAVGRRPGGSDQRAFRRGHSGEEDRTRLGSSPHGTVPHLPRRLADLLRQSERLSEGAAKTPDRSMADVDCLKAAITVGASRWLARFVCVRFSWLIAIAGRQGYNGRCLLSEANNTLETPMSILLTRPGKHSLIVETPVMPAAGTFGFGEQYRSLIDVDKLGALVTNPVTY